MNDSDTVSIPLRRDEAIVLFDLLARWMEDEKGLSIKDRIRDDAELWALNDAYCRLQSILAEPFDGNFSNVVERVRQKVRTAHGGDWPYAG